MLRQLNYLRRIYSDLGAGQIKPSCREMFFSQTSFCWAAMQAMLAWDCWNGLGMSWMTWKTLLAAQSPTKNPWRKRFSTPRTIHLGCKKPLPKVPAPRPAAYRRQSTASRPLPNLLGDFVWIWDRYLMYYTKFWLWRKTVTGCTKWMDNVSAKKLLLVAAAADAADTVMNFCGWWTMNRKTRPFWIQRSTVFCAM